MPTPRSKKPISAARPAARSADVPRAWSLALGLATFLAYLALCPPVSGDKDSAEFTLVLALAGAAHPSGYPLFTLLGHAWVMAWHALGASWAYAANAWTALGGALALALLHRLGIALLAPMPSLGRPARAALSALPVAFLVFNPIWTYETTLAEVYAWHVAWALGMALCFVSIVRLVGRGGDPRVLFGRAALWGFLCGVGAAHHLTSVFVVVPLTLALLVVLARRGALRPSLVVAGLMCACVPLLSYGFILWRALHPAGVAWPWLRPGLDGLIEHVTGRQYANRFGRFTPSAEQARFLAWYVWPFLLPGLGLLAWLTVRARGLAERAIAWGLAGSALVATAYAFSYGVPDPSSYFLQPLAFGLVALVPLLGTGIASKAPGRAQAAAWASLALAVALWGPWIGVGVGRAGLYVQFDRYVRSMWQSIPFDRAFVFWTNDMHYKLDERQLLDHEKPGIEILNAGVLQGAEPRRRFIEAQGFDPVPPVVEGSDVEGQIEERVNALSALPVIHFDPEKGTVRLLKKAAPGDSL